MDREIKEEENNKKEEDTFKYPKFDIPHQFKFEKEYLSNYFKPRTTKRGRFTIEDYSALESKFEVSREYKKGRFHVIETKPLKETREDCLKKIIELQNKQINLLYSMLKEENKQFVEGKEEINDLLKKI